MSIRRGRSLPGRAPGEDIAAFEAWIEVPHTRLALDRRDTPAGLAGLQRGTHVAALFVSPGRRRQGSGSRLLQYLVVTSQAQNARELAAASRLSLALFEQQGFRVSRRDVTTVRGAAFTRHAMIPELGNPA